MPKIIPGLSESEYHKARALSASGAWVLANSCPALYWYRSPFNPHAAPPEDGEAMDIGTALHLAVLEPERLERRMALCPGDDWRTKAAQTRRDEARAIGLVPLLEKHVELIYHLREALLGNPYVADLLDGADTEISYFWDADDVPAKARADIIARDGLALGDLKASGSASPEFFQRQAFNVGHFLRAAWYSSGWNVAANKIAAYWFIVVSREPPHIITICRLDERALSWGEMMARRAIELFKICRERNEWPGYSKEPAILSLPSWAEFRLADKEAAGAFAKPVPGESEIMSAIGWLAP